MDKIAMVKQAEVAGVLGALVQADLVKVANEEHFDALVDAVSGSIEGTEYGIDDVIAKTAEILEEVDALEAAEAGAEVGAGVEKEAGEEEVDETAVMAAMGELTLAKMAGEIDEETFAKEAADLGGMLRGAASKAKDIAAAAAGKAKDAGKAAGAAAAGKAKSGLSEYVKALKGLKGEKLKATMNLNKVRAASKNLDKAPASLKPGLKELGKGVAAVAAPAAAAGYGAKKLYDKYKK